jgi:diguanylate cyclase (GGDEF)-like protein
MTRDGTGGLREQLEQLLAEDSHNTERLTARLDALARETGLGVHAALLLVLTQLPFDEEEAREHWEAILGQRHALSLSLGRDVGLRVATLDYFMNVNRRLVQPTLIDLAFETTSAAGADALTGLTRDRGFRAGVSAELRRARRYGHAMAIVLFDLDGFAAVNEKVTPLVADRLLREAAMLLGNKIRDIDLAARPGEDELAVLLPETDRNGAYLVAERFRREVESHFSRREAAGRAATLTVSGGVAAYPEDASDAEALLARAAQALYQAKAAGKNAVLLHTPERRRFLRFDLGTRRAEVEVVGARDLAGGRIRNTSGSGLLFTSPEPIDVGEGIVIRLEGGGGEAPRRVMTLRGRVVRLEELPTAADERFEVGVAFDPEGAPPEGDLLEFLEGASSS